MGSKVYLTNVTSDQSGYLLAMVDMRNPNLPAAVATAVTNTATGGGTTALQMSGTAGGTSVHWITRKLSKAVTLGANTFENVFVNWSASINQSFGNAGLQLRLAKFTGGAQGSAFLQDNNNLGVTGAKSASGQTALGSTGPNAWTTTTALSGNTTFTQTAFAVGDRLVIEAWIVPALGVNMAAGAATTLNYDGLPGSTGDSYIEVFPQLQVSQAQVGSGSNPGIKNASVGTFNELVVDLQTVNPGSASTNGGTGVTNSGGGGLYNDDTTILAAINEALLQKGLV
jgi:hypothetical protein